MDAMCFYGSLFTWSQSYFINKTYKGNLSGRTSGSQSKEYWSMLFKTESHTQSNGPAFSSMWSELGSFVHTIDMYRKYCGSITSEYASPLHLYEKINSLGSQTVHRQLEV